MSATGETVPAAPVPGWRWARAFRQRFYDVVASVYLYNEHTGWQGLERLLEAVKRKLPGETDFHAVIAKHAADERKHYFLFRKHFQTEGRMPLQVDATFGYVDQFIRLIFRQPLDRLDQEAILADDRQFFRMCRLIMMTEFRGMKQVASLLENRMIRRNPSLLRIYRVIEEDEPSHCLPYQRWLEAKGSHLPGFQERITDLWIHWSLVLIKFPLLFLNWRTPRLGEFPT